MKFIPSALVILVLCFLLPSIGHAAESVQDQINRASAGDTVELEEGIYEEAIKLTKSITLKGNGKVTLRSCGEQPSILIEGKGVTLEDIKVEQCGGEKKSAAIHITGSGHLIKDVTVKTKSDGIQLDGADHVTIENSEINGIRKGNGLDLWKSDQNIIRNVKVSDVLDGIYLEQSHRNTVKKNSITGSRYGMHFMYADYNRLEENDSKNNTTGTMLMEAKGTAVIDNRFSYNRENVNAQGLLMYYVTDTEIIGNHMKANRVGMYMENSQGNLIKRNELTDNFIGIQFNKAKDNEITENTFAGNMNAAQALGSSENSFRKNYWDAAAKVDMEGKGISVIPFYADPYFITLTSDVPEYQLFFQSPGLAILQKMLKSPEDKLLKDEAPLMEPSVAVSKAASSGSVLWALSAIMAGFSLLLFILGRKRI